MHLVFDLVRSGALFLASYMNFAMMLSLGLGFSFADWRRRASGRTIAATLVTTYLVNPALAILAVWLLPFKALGVATLLLMSISPGSPNFLLQAKGLEGGLAKGINLAGASAVVAVAYIPLALWGMGRFFDLELGVSPGEIFKITVIGVLVPFIAGVLLRHFAPKASNTIARYANRFFQAAYFAVTVILIVAGVPLLLTLPLWVYLVMFALTFASAYAAYKLSGPDPVERRISVPVSVMASPAIVFYVASRAFEPGISLLEPVAAYLLVRSLMMAVFQRWNSRREKKLAG